MKRPLLILPIILLAGCGGSNKAHPPTELPDARTVIATTTQGAATTVAKTAHAVGETARIDPIELTITKATRLTPADMKRTLTAPATTWLIVELTARNPSNDSASLPNIEIVCPVGEANRYFDDDPTAIRSQAMPSKTQLSGRFIYGVPDGCSPATLTAMPVLQVDGKPLPQFWTLP